MGVLLAENDVVNTRENCVELGLGHKESYALFPVVPMP